MAATGDLYKVWETRPLMHKPNAAAAAAILENIAKQVQPIMRRHLWSLNLLSELCQYERPDALGLNLGWGLEIKIRLRIQGNDWGFRPYEEILDTMLHELCHNVIYHHNAQFNMLWDELRKECAELAAKGITETGQGFDPRGRRLGGSRVQRRSPALAAATQKRRRVGDDVREEGGETKTGDSGKGGKSVKDAYAGLGSSSSPITEEDMDREVWECSICTLLNKPPALICEACGIQKLDAVSLYSKTWSCRFCTLQNDIKLDKCTACEQWRYSYGPPASHTGPNNGT